MASAFGRERRQVGDRGVLGVVRGAVDGLDLRAGADREEHLGGGRRHRHDRLGLFVEGELAVVAGDGDRERLLLGRGRACRCPRRRRRNCRRRRSGPGGAGSSSAAGRARRRRGWGHGSLRREAATSLTERRPAPRCATLTARVGDMTQGRRSGSGPRKCPHSCGTAPDSHRTSLPLRHRHTGRRGEGTRGAVSADR